MLLGDALTITRLCTCTAVAPAKACHVAVNGNRGGSVAIIAEKPLRAKGGFFSRSQQLTNGQPCFLTRSHPGFISSSSLEMKKKIQSIQYAEQSFYKAKTWFYSFNGVCVCVCVCVYIVNVYIQLFPLSTAGLAPGQWVPNVTPALFFFFPFPARTRHVPDYNLKCDGKNERTNNDRQRHRGEHPRVRGRAVLLGGGGVGSFFFNFWKERPRKRFIKSRKTSKISRWKIYNIIISVYQTSIVQWVWFALWEIKYTLHSSFK